MKRAGFLCAAGFLAAAVNAGLSAPVPADCGGELRALRAKAAAVKDDRRRQEIQKLLEKAEKDNAAGRAQLCADAVQHARALLK
jgi:hypothetical protein